MSNTAIFILIAIVVIGGIFWLVILAGRRGEKHRQKTSIKVSDSPDGGRTSWYFELPSLLANTSESPGCEARSGRANPARRSQGQWAAASIGLLHGGIPVCLWLEKDVMKNAEKRKYKGGDFGVNVGAKVPPVTFNEIENLARALGKTRAEVVRLLLSRGLAEYHRDEKLSAQPSMPLAEAQASYNSTDDK
jgi:hypothetical protein